MYRAKGQTCEMYDPVKDSVKALLGSGQEGRVDGTQDTCSLMQVQGACSLGKVLFVTNVAIGTVKLAGTISFAKTIDCRSKASEGCFLEKAKKNGAAIIKCI